MAQQKIVHGATIDTVTPAEMAALIAAAIPAQEEATYHQEKGVVTLDATGAGVAQIKLTRMYGWRCERVTVSAVPAAAAIIQFFENQQQGTDMREVIGLGAAGLYSDGFANKMFIPAGSTILVVVTGGSANGQLSWNIQSELVKVANG